MMQSKENIALCDSRADDSLRQPLFGRNELRVNGTYFGSGVCMRALPILNDNGTSLLT